MVWENKIVGYGDEPPEQIKSNPLNWRLHPQHQREIMNDILDEVGWVSQVIINKQSGLLLDGHLRVEEALRNDEQSIPVTYVDLSEDEERQVLATLDPLSALIETDDQKLNDLLQLVNTNSEHIAMLLDGLQPDTSATRKEVKDKVEAKKRVSETARVMFGPYKFEISFEEYEEWLERVRDTHGTDVIAIMSGMKEMLLITEREEGLSDASETKTDSEAPRTETVEE
jgi:hypothetical protein